MRVGLEHPDMSGAPLAPGVRQALVDEVVLVVGAKDLDKASTFFTTANHFFLSLKGYLLVAKLKEKGWTLQPGLVNKSINLGSTNAQRIDQALKVQSCDAISLMHCLTSLKIVEDVIMAPSVQPTFVYFFWSALPYSINFD